MTNRLKVGKNAAIWVILAFVGAPSQAQPIAHFENTVHGHHFWSGLFAERYIQYIVCNNSGADSDFFWPMAGFGVGQNQPFSSAGCLPLKDYAASTGDDGQPLHGNLVSNVEVRDQGGEVPTLFWCEYLGLDRCGYGLTSWAASMASRHRALGRGPSDDPVPILDVEIARDGERYRIAIEYSEAAGRIIVIARRSSTATATFEDLDNQIIDHTPVGELINLGDQAIHTGLTPEMAAFTSPPAESTGGFFGFYFSDTEVDLAPLSFVTLRDRDIGYRIDFP